MTVSRRNFLAGAAAAPLVLNRFPAFAQEAWPAKEIHVICGYAPGTGADILVRYFAEKLRKYTNKPMLVENKPGAGTSIASEYVSRAKPDGYTLFINPGNGLAGNPYLYKNLSHDVLNDFAPVTTLVKLPFCLAVAPNSPAKNMKEFLALMKQKGDKASYGYPNNLSLAAGELLNERAGLKAVGVAYKSTPEAMNDMTNGLIDYLFSDATFGLAQAKAGKMRMLAFTSSDALGSRSEPADNSGKRRAELQRHRVVGRLVSGQDAAADRRSDVEVAQRNSRRSGDQGISGEDRAGRSVSRHAGIHLRISEAGYSALGRTVQAGKDPAAVAHSRLAASHIASRRR